LEFYIWKRRIPRFTSNEPRTPRELRNQELREKVEFLSTNVPHLKEDKEFQSRPYPTKLKRIKREEEALEKTIENLKNGKFP
jgi:cell division protein FtsB